MLHYVWTGAHDNNRYRNCYLLIKQSFSYQNNPKDLTLSCKMDLDLYDHFGRENSFYRWITICENFGLHEFIMHTKCNTNNGSPSYAFTVWIYCICIYWYNIFHILLVHVMSLYWEIAIATKDLMCLLCVGGAVFKETQQKWNHC